jgi:hypothetical protein
MKILLIGAVGLSFWLAAIPASAQTPNPPKPTGKQTQRAVPSPARRAPATTPEEQSHRAMVEEQERRDREAEAERDRDDL